MKKAGGSEIGKTWRLKRVSQGMFPKHGVIWVWCEVFMWLCDRNSLGPRLPRLLAPTRKLHHLEVLDFTLFAIR